MSFRLRFETISEISSCFVFSSEIVSFSFFLCDVFRPLYVGRPLDGFKLSVSSKRLILQSDFGSTLDHCIVAAPEDVLAARSLFAELLQSWRLELEKA